MPRCGPSASGRGGRSWQSCSSETLWRDTLEKNPAAWLAHNNLAGLLRNEGRTSEAISHYREALRLQPELFLAHYNLGTALSDVGSFADAIDSYTRAVELSPTFGRAYNGRGIAHANLGDLPRALEDFRIAVPLLGDPASARDAASAHYNLGLVLQQAGSLEDAAVNFAEAVRLDPAHWRAERALEQLRAPVTRSPLPPS